MPEIVEQLASEFGNPDLGNEKVHSFEAGWRSRFLEGKLSLTLDVFYNIYQDTIYFYVSVPLRLGLPDIANGSFHYENQTADIHALGGELELSASLTKDLVLWGNLHFRKVTNAATNQDLETEPSLRINLGGGYRPDSGIQIDLALHYVTTYRMATPDPANLFGDRLLVDLGDNALCIGRAGYRLALRGDWTIESGMQFRIPLGNPFREFAGVEWPEWIASSSTASHGGNPLHPWFGFYLRGSF